MNKSIFNNFKEKFFILTSAVLFLYSLAVGIFGAPFFLVYRPQYLMLLAILGFLSLPSNLFKEKSIFEEIFNIAFMIITVFLCTWIQLNWLPITTRFRLTNSEVIMGAILLLCVLELCRRTTAKALNYVFLAALLYAYFGKHIRGLFWHGGMSLERIVWIEVFTHEGLFGSVFGIGTYFIGLFIFFVAFMEVSGAADRFMTFSLAASGHLTGGPAKVAVFSSALLGMISGSSVTNIVTTGSITIPMMKKIGFKDHTAAGVEASASLGSQFMPPIMGTSAFVMAEYTGTSYLNIMLAGLIPAILFFWGSYVQVHFRSIKLGIEGMPRDQLPDLRKATIDMLPLMIPIIFLVYLLFRRYSTQYAISLTIISFFVVMLLDKKARPQILKRFFEGLKNGGQSIISVMLSLAVAGMVVGLFTVTGLGDRLAYIIEALSGGNLVLAIILTAIITSIMGMGMVTVGAYIFVATLTAPLLVSMGVPLLVAHFFIFFFAVLSAITPPVMIGVFAASGIAGSKLIPTAKASLKLAVVGFLVPFMFIADPCLLILEGEPIFPTIIAFVTAIIGVIGIGSFFEQYSFAGKISILESIIILIGGIFCLFPPNYLYINVIGLIIMGVAHIKVHQRHSAKS